ncbi:hypothetical protein RIF29_05854 [Crotalaria pallida]|uniref:Uncharacterized protein n=1 Tax=Crotalaria pallida TaxID=3830 RepID=A0AAN9PAW7_CROPI
MPSVPLQHSSIASQSNNQYLDSMQCMHCKGVLPTSTPKQQANSIVPLQRWHDHNNQDANYHSNFIGNSINSMTPMNGAVDPERRTSTYTTEQESLKQHQLYSMYQQQQQQQSQHQTCNANNNHGSFEDLITEMTKTLKKEISKEMAASRDENRQLRETIEAMMKQQDTLMQAAQQIILSRQLQQQPEPAQAFTNVSPDVVMENQPEPAQTIAEASPDAMMEQQPNQQEKPEPAQTFTDASPNKVMTQQPEPVQTFSEVSPNAMMEQQPNQQEQPGPAHTFGDDSPDAVMEQQQQPELTQTVKDVSPHGVTTQQPNQNSCRSRPRHPLMSRSSSSA